MPTLTALISTLEQIGDESNNKSVEARGLLHQVRAFPFLLSLVLFEKIFYYQQSFQFTTVRAD